MRRICHVAAVLGALVALGPASRAAAQVEIGGWNVTVEGGVGRPVKTAILLAPDGASLIAACDAKGVDLLVSYLDPLPKEPQLPVTWRLDEGAAHNSNWEEASDHTSLSPGGPEEDAAVLKQLAHGRRLTISASGHKAVFDLTGVRQISNLLGECPPLPAAAPAGPTSGGAAGQ